LPSYLADATLDKMKNGKKTSFPKLRKKIWISLFVLPSTLVLLIVIISASVLAVYMDSDYRSSIVESVNLSEADFSSSLGVLDDDLLLLSSDEDVVSYASTGEGLISASDKITSAKNASESILGITLYGSSETIKTASWDVSGYPDKMVVLSDPAIASFVSGSQDSLLLIRNKNIADNFGFLSYDESYGILSLFVRISDSKGATKGFLLADLDSQYLYNSFFDYTDYSRFVVADSFIVSGDIFLRSKSNDAFSSYFPFSRSGSLEGINFDYSYLWLDFGTISVITIVSNEKPRTQMAILLSSALAIDVILTLSDFYITHLMEKKLVGSLDGMVDKMKNTSI